MSLLSSQNQIPTKIQCPILSLTFWGVGGGSHRGIDTIVALIGLIVYAAVTLRYIPSGLSTWLQAHNFYVHDGTTLGT